jgi:hypothetical protein
MLAVLWPEICIATFSGTPPQIDPSFANNGNVDYWQGQNATRAPENDNWTFSIQRKISPSTIFEADYNGVIGNHLQSGTVNTNQVPMAVVNQLVQQYGTTQAVNLLNSNITSSTAVAAGFRPLIQISRTPRCNASSLSPSHAV